MAFDRGNIQEMKNGTWPGDVLSFLGGDDLKDLAYKGFHGSLSAAWACFYTALPKHGIIFEQCTDGEAIVRILDWDGNENEVALSEYASSPHAPDVRMIAARAIVIAVVDFMFSRGLGVAFSRAIGEGDAA